MSVHNRFESLIQFAPINQLYLVQTYWLRIFSARLFVYFVLALKYTVYVHIVEIRLRVMD